jgi:predicted acyltransferase
MQSSPVVDYASPSTEKRSPRLLSLDVFRGLVILAMLLVNNIGDGATTGYFWKHADWVPMRWGEAWKAWWGYARGAEFWRARGGTLEFQMREIFDRVTGEERSADRVGARPPVPAVAHTDAYWQHVEDWRALARHQEALDQEHLMAIHPWSRIPLFTHCTLADYVMPWFMLIIGVAIPFSVAASVAKAVNKNRLWLRTIQRAATLVALGWILCYFRDQFANSLYGKSAWSFSLGMDVLQLLGISYLVARILYGLSAKPRTAIACALFVGHWAILRFCAQGGTPPGTFNREFDAISYIYAYWKFWDLIALHLGPITIGWRGLMSVPPAAATMLIGTLIGDRLRHTDLNERQKVSSLAKWSALMAVIGFLWAFDLPFNKPRWTPCYLLWTSGVGTMLIALLYWIIDVKQIRGWTYPLVVFGTNAIALYFCSILAKVLLLNTLQVHGRPVVTVMLETLKGALGPWAGGWAFTLGFVLFWWVIMDQMYRRRVFWKL